MKSISLRFRTEMEQATRLIELIGSVRELAKQDITAFKSKHPIAKSVRSVHIAALAFASTPIAYDGAYLAICGRFELTVRELVEKFVELVTRDLPTHSHLPAAIRDWHAKGSADIILRIHEEQFKHLTIVNLIGNLASCLHPSASSPYKLTPEAYSFNNRNFRATEVDSLLSERLGLTKVWQKLARHQRMIDWSGANHTDTIENLCRSTLNNCMERRNAIVHRGRSYYTPGATEVIQCATFLSALVDAIEETMTAYKASL
jgi:hypothetical protein